MSTVEVEVQGGRILRVHAADQPASPRLTLLWHHGSPHTGAPLDPLVEIAAQRGIRVITYARPSYGGSTPQPGRTVGSAGHDARAILDALDVRQAVTMGYSGGGPQTTLALYFDEGNVAAYGWMFFIISAVLLGLHIPLLDRAERSRREFLTGGTATPWYGPA